MDALINNFRRVFENFLEWSDGQNCYAWGQYAEMEARLRQTERARAIYELAVKQPVLDRPEAIWKKYIEFEISEGEFERASALYDRLLERTNHLKIWLSYAAFEARSMKIDEDLDEDGVLQLKEICRERARSVFERYVEYFKSTVGDEREDQTAMLLEEWAKFGDPADVDLVCGTLLDMEPEIYVGVSSDD